MPNDPIINQIENVGASRLAGCAVKFAILFALGCLALGITVKRTHDPELEKPAELRALNKKLGPLYGEKEDILRRFPHLEAEYGGKKRKQGASPLGVSRSVDKAERKAKKKANHEKNLARRRDEDRARARGGTGKGGKKKD